MRPVPGHFHNRRLSKRPAESNLLSYMGKFLSPDNVKRGRIHRGRGDGVSDSDSHGSVSPMESSFVATDDDASPGQRESTAAAMRREAVLAPAPFTYVRDVFVVMSPAVADAHTTLIGDLRANGFTIFRRPVSGEWAADADPCADDDGDGTASPTKRGDNTFPRCFFRFVCNEHNTHLENRAGPGFRGRRTPRPWLCVVFEDDSRCCREAADLGMCVIGLARSELERRQMLTAAGAAVTAKDVDAVLRHFHVDETYQLQYLPYAARFAEMTSHKAGYPVSFLDMICGRYTATGVDVVHSTQWGATPSAAAVGDGDVLVNSGWPNQARLVPRQVLGISPASLADDYINNVGWTLDSIRGWSINTRDLEKDIVAFFARLYQVPSLNMRGFVTSGGTEGNFAGLWWQRDYLRANSVAQSPKAVDVASTTSRLNVNVSFPTDDDDTAPEMEAPMPIVITSSQTHYSVFKAAQQLGMSVHRVPTDAIGAMHPEAFRTSVKAVQKAVPGRSILVNVTAGTTQTTAIDDIPAMKRVLDELAGPNASLGSRSGSMSMDMDSISVDGGAEIATAVEEPPPRFRYGIHLDAALLGGILPVLRPYRESSERFKKMRQPAHDRHASGPLSPNVHDEEKGSPDAATGNKTPPFCPMSPPSPPSPPPPPAAADNIFLDLGVTTMAISGHKFFGSVGVCGLCLTTADFLDRCFGTDAAAPVTYVKGLHDITPSGSRSFHNTLCALDFHTDRTRLCKVVRQCYRNKVQFCDTMARIVGSCNVRTAGQHAINVWFPRPQSEQLEEKWNMMPIDLPPAYVPAAMRAAHRLHADPAASAGPAGAAATSPGKGMPPQLPGADSEAALRAAVAGGAVGTAGTPWRGKWVSAAMLLNFSPALVREFADDYRADWVAAGRGDPLDATPGSSGVAIFQ